MTNRHRTMRGLTRWCCCTLAILASGCVTVDRTAGVAGVDRQVTQARPGPFTLDVELDVASASRRVDELLAAPLSARDAVEISLLRNPRMASEFARLGIAQADIVAASRLANPVIAGSRLSGNGARKTTLGLTESLSDLLLLAPRKRFAAGTYERTQELIASEVLTLAADAESAWLRYAAALGVSEIASRILQAANAAAELARRTHDAGNFSELELLTQQTVAVRAEIAATRAANASLEAKFELHQIMGLSGAPAWSVAPLPAVPTAAEDALDALLELGATRRADLSAARKEVELRADALKVAKRWRWLGAISVGVEREGEVDGVRLTGPTLALALPIFHQGQAGFAEAEYRFEDSRARLRALEASIDGAIRFGHERVLVTRRIVETYQTSLLPQHETIVDRQQERQNFMFIGQFELIAAKAEQYEAERAAAEAGRDYWLARVELARATGGRLPSDSGAQP